MRFFVGIPLPEEVVAHLLDVRRAVEPRTGKVGWTRADNLHITLKFLGEVEEKRVAEVAGALRRVTGPGFRLRGEGVACFPPRGAVRIIAAEFGGAGVERLGELQSMIELACEVMGFERERRAYRPHATIGRARGVIRADVRGKIEEATRGLWPGPEFEVGEYVLFESRETGRGREYVAAARVGLG